MAVLVEVEGAVAAGDARGDESYEVGRRKEISLFIEASSSRHRRWQLLHFVTRGSSVSERGTGKRTFALLPHRPPSSTLPTLSSAYRTPPPSSPSLTALTPQNPHLTAFFTSPLSCRSLSFSLSSALSRAEGGERGRGERLRAAKERMQEPRVDCVAEEAEEESEGREGEEDEEEGRQRDDSAIRSSSSPALRGLTNGSPYALPAKLPKNCAIRGSTPSPSSSSSS